jgi:Tfp pilus assembly protein PilF
MIKVRPVVESLSMEQRNYGTAKKSALERYMLGHKYFSKEPRNGPAAEREFRRAISLDPVAFQEAYGWLAIIYRESGQLDSAIATLREAIRVSPEDPRYPIMLGGIHLERKEYNKAVHRFSKGLALKTNPEEADTDIVQIVLHLREGKTEEACTEWRRLLALEPMYPRYKAPHEEAKELLAQHEGTS